jgi:transposase
LENYRDIRHAGHFRTPFTADQIDEVIEHTLTHCPSCGTQLEDAGRALSVIQQVKIVKKPVKIEEHRGIPYWCPVCQCVHYAPMPEEVDFNLSLLAGRYQRTT